MFKILRKKEINPSVKLMDIEEDLKKGFVSFVRISRLL